MIWIPRGFGLWHHCRPIPLGTVPALKCDLPQPFSDLLRPRPPASLRSEMRPLHNAGALFRASKGLKCLLFVHVSAHDFSAITTERTTKGTTIKSYWLSISGFPVSRAGLSFALREDTTLAPTRFSMFSRASPAMEPPSRAMLLL